jgi:hypothetical protein
MSSDHCCLSPTSRRRRGFITIALVTSPLKHVTESGGRARAQLGLGATLGATRMNDPRFSGLHRTAEMNVAEVTD